MSRRQGPRVSQNNIVAFALIPFLFNVNNQNGPAAATTISVFVLNWGFSIKTLPGASRGIVALLFLLHIKHKNVVASARCYERPYVQVKSKPSNPKRDANKKIVASAVLVFLH